MLQIDVMPYASDALEDAMRLAQTKSLNSYTFSDCLNYLNYAWSDIYSRMAMIEDGYYGKSMRLTSKLTHLPDYVKNTVMVYQAQSPLDCNRRVYRDAGTSDIVASGTYRISGKDIYCHDADSQIIWLYYVPACPQIFFTHHNRDPKLLDTATRRLATRYGMFELHGYIDNTEIAIGADTTEETLKECNKWVLKHLSGNSDYDKVITDYIIKDTDDLNGTYKLVFISCHFPYIFCTYQNNLTGEYYSGFYNKDFDWTEYNPFAFTGKTSNVKYITSDWNDKTGMGVAIEDYNDLNEEGSPRIKELGWTPDTQLNYPVPEMYRYLVARLADKFSALNESNVMGVQKELVEARFAFEAFLEKDKSAWKRIENVNPASIGDYL